MSTHWLILIATVSWGIWGLALKKAVLHMPPLAAYVAFGAMSLVLVPGYIGLARLWDVPLRFPAVGTAWAMAAASCVGVGTVSLLYAMRGREASSVVALTATYPLVTLVLAIALLGERLTPHKAGGAAAIALGVYLLNR